MDGASRWATVNGVAKSRTRLSNFTFFLFGLQTEYNYNRYVARALSIYLCAT